MRGKDERRGAEGGDDGRRPRRLSTSALALGLLVFLAALGVRLLMRQDARLEAGRVQTAVTSNYKHMARLLAEGGVGGFFSASAPSADPDTLGHPPGYPVVIALAGAAGWAEDSELQLVSVAADALAAVFVLLIALELFSPGVALAAGLLAALAPQFAWNSVLLLPDTLAALPVVVAVYLVARACRRPGLAWFLAAGVLVGLSCWLRANALLLAPFLAAAVLVTFEREVRTRYALAVVAGALLAVAPLTLRNAVVFGAFIPVSLGAGQTMLEGIADYDESGGLGIPATDLGIMRQEAAEFARPDYAETLFGPDAVVRERRRLARARAVIFRHPLWFASVMARRAASMLRLERARRVSPRPQVTRELEPPAGAAPVWPAGPREPLNPEGHFVSAPAEVADGTDYLFRVPYRVARGRMTVSVTGREGEGVLTSTVVEPLEGVEPDAQPMREVRLAFVADGVGAVRLVFGEAGGGPSSVVARPELYALGPASNLWTRYPRAGVALLQKLFITAVMLPLALAGLVLMAREKKWHALALLLAVPVYYLCVQSALHTEYRYVLALHYFLFAAVAYALGRAARKASSWLASTARSS